MTRASAGAPAMRTYRSFLGSGALAALALGAATIADGDGQSALVAFAGFSGGAFLVSLRRLLATGERPALGRPAPAAEPRREAPPSAGAPPRRARRKARPRARLSSTPS